MVREQSRRRFLRLAAAGATSVGVSSVASRKSRAVPAVGDPSVIVQTGTAIVGHGTADGWQRVDFEVPFELTPVVIVQPVATRKPASVPIYIRKVTRRGFEFRHSAGDRRTDTPERVSYIAVARGVHALPGALIHVEAGFVAAAESPRTVPFDHPFTERPIVFAQAQTHASHRGAAGPDDSIVTRFDVAGSDWFSVCLHDRRRYQRTRRSETVGYLAFEPGAGVLDPPMGALNGLLGRFEIATAPNSITKRWHQLAFEHTYDQPILLAGTQTRTENEIVTIRVDNLDSEGAAIRLEKEHGDRRGDPAQRVGYAVFENEHLLYV